MNASNSHRAAPRGIKWLALGFGTAMLFSASNSFVQSQTKPETKKEAQTTSSSMKPASAAPKNATPMISNDNGQISFAVFHKPVSVPARGSNTNSAPQTKTVRIWDACDPDSFNAAVGPGTCIPGHHGQTNFQDFFNELNLDKIAGGWRFNPLLNATDGSFKLVQLELQPGDRISLENVGGETHTFTKVSEYGGGFFDPLNARTGNPTPAPECARVLANGTLAPQPESDTNQFVEAATTEAGPLAGTPVLPLGVTHWQCCIHPWMRINIAVRDSENNQGQNHDHSQNQQ
jgi:hypothetical protein